MTRIHTIGSKFFYIGKIIIFQVYLYCILWLLQNLEVNFCLLWCVYIILLHENSFF